MAERLGARKDAAFKAVSTAPSFNKTPVGSATPPLPYPVTQDLSSSTGTVNSVLLNGQPAYVLDGSKQPTCIGDAAGSLGGVKSGTVGGKVEPVKGSGTVRFGGKPSVREGDPCTLNSGNCPGVYVTAPEPARPAPGQAKADANPPVRPETPAEQGWWAKASPWVHGVLGVASFIPGVSVVAGGLDAAIYTAEGNLVEAGLSAAAMIPGGKVATTVGKGVKGAAAIAKGTKAADAGADVAKAAGKLDHAADGAKAAQAGKGGGGKPPAPPPAPPPTPASPSPGGGKGGGTRIAKGRSQKIGKCGEYLAKRDMEAEGFEVLSAQNKSGHGVDLVGRNPKTGEVKVWEVKTTTTDKAPPLTKAQSKLGGEAFAADRLGKAAEGYKNFGKVREAIEAGKAALRWLEQANAKGAPITYEKLEMFIDDIDKGCAKHPTRRSRSAPWNPKGE